MPMGLLGLEWPVDSDPLIPQRGGRREGRGEDDGQIQGFRFLRNQY